MFERIKSLLARPRPTAPRAAAPLFHRFYRYPDLFSFSLTTLDFELLVRPQTGARSEVDTLLLLVFAYQEIFKAPAADEAFICRKFGVGEGRERPTSFAHALAQTRTEAAVRAIEACLDDGDLERLTEASGDSLSLTPQGHAKALALADIMQRALASGQAQPGS